MELKFSNDSNFIKFWPLPAEILSATHHYPIHPGHYIPDIRVSPKNSLNHANWKSRMATTPAILKINFWLLLPNRGNIPLSFPGYYFHLLPPDLLDLHFLENQLWNEPNLHIYLFICIFNYLPWMHLFRPGRITGYWAIWVETCTVATGWPPDRC